MTAVTLVVLALVVAVAPTGAGAGSGRGQDSGPPLVPPNSVSAFGTAAASGPDGSERFAAPIADLAAAGGSGYWVATADGTVSAHGTAPRFGSLSARPRRPVVGIASIPSAAGYRLVSADGGVFSFGDAGFHGSLGGRHLDSPVVGMGTTPTGDGYWLVAADGGVFSFGDANFRGSLAGVTLRAPIVALAATPTGAGYWLAAADGGVFAFGDAEPYGGADAGTLPAPITDMAAAPSGQGYWLVSRDGQVHPFGVGEKGSPADAGAIDGAANGIATASDNGYWVAHGERLETAPGQAGPDVQRHQRRLTELGYWLGPVDGRYGRLTTQAVYAFQKLESLPVTGTIDPDTARRLLVAERPRAANPAGDLIEIDKTRQVALVVRRGQVAFAFNASTGTEDTYFSGGRRYQAQTPSGQYVIHRQRDGVAESRLGRLARPKYFHPAGIAIHGSSFVPPYAASHGCARIPTEANDFIWSNDLAPVGSAVSVYGTTTPAR